MGALMEFTKGLRAAELSGPSVLGQGPTDHEAEGRYNNNFKNLQLIELKSAESLRVGGLFGPCLCRRSS